MKRTPDRPVFIVGDARSGTTLMYRLLRACPEFPLYQAETHLLDVGPVAFGSLESEPKFQAFRSAWIESKQFARSGLTVSQLDAAWHDVPRHYPALLGAFMEMIAFDQNKPRWIEKTPAHVDHIEELNADFPDAFFLHMIRDPRDVALSRSRLGWVANVVGDQSKMISACLEWESMIRNARQIGKQLPGRYLEIRFEDLIASPKLEFSKICAFVGVPMCEEALLQLKTANSSFDNAESGEDQSTDSAVRRWERLLSDAEKAAANAAVGPTLADLGYPSGTSNGEWNQAALPLRARIAWLDLRAKVRHFLKHRTPLRRLSRATLDPVEDSGPA